MFERAIESGILPYEDRLFGAYSLLCLNADVISYFSSFMPSFVARDKSNLTVVLSVVYVLTSSGSQCLVFTILSPSAAHRSLYAAMYPC